MAQSNDSSASHTNYVAYRTNSGQNRIGSLVLETSKVQPLAFKSGAPISDLYQVIEVGESHIKPSGDAIDLASVTLLPPISGRDVLAVGKNYADHAKEFNQSGFDSSDKVDQPTHPVIFTKRATSIIASGEPILPHAGFTESVDFEGEIGVIIGKAGFRISEADAMGHVWGYTIINDVTARERQRDHKQFYIGKSPDTFCPMGPIAVPASHLPKTLAITTHVNGQKRQDATTESLIFSIPTLIATLSAGQTLLPGDVLATGTPAGVGIGQKPPVFLHPGDEVAISVTGLGTLANKIASPSEENPTLQRYAQKSSLPIFNTKTGDGHGLTALPNGKKLFYRKVGKEGGGKHIILIHGLGGSSEFYTPLISLLNLSNSYTLHLLDLEGHGLSPTSAASVISLQSYADDIQALVAPHISQGEEVSLIAHSMGCLVALTLILSSSFPVHSLALLGPPPTPLPAPGRAGMAARAALLRSSGLGPAAVVDAIIAGGTSSLTKEKKPLAVAAVRMSVLAMDAEGYAKGCEALGSHSAIDLDAVKRKLAGGKVLVVTGSEDGVSPPKIAEAHGRALGAEVKVLEGVGHWHVFEDGEGVAGAVGGFLGK